MSMFILFMGVVCLKLGILLYLSRYFFKTCNNMEPTGMFFQKIYHKFYNKVDFKGAFPASMYILAIIPKFKLFD